MNREPVSAGQVILETDRLLLRPWRVSDAALQRKLSTERDPGAPRHRRTSPDGHPTIEDLKDWIRSEVPPASLGMLSAERRDSGEAIGYCGLIRTGRMAGRSWRMSFCVMSGVQSYATEAAQTVLGWATDSGYRHLGATILDWNTAPRRVTNNLGFVETTRVEPIRGYFRGA